jgi:hypothetical protein
MGIPHCKIDNGGARLVRKFVRFGPILMEFSAEIQEEVRMVDKEMK